MERWYPSCLLTASTADGLMVERRPRLCEVIAIEDGKLRRARDEQDQRQRCAHRARLPTIPIPNAAMRRETAA
jgi:hypothetical protein